MKNKYEFLDHVTDIEMKVYGETKEEVFRNALLGMNESLEIEQIKPGEEKEIEILVEAGDVSLMLADFLSAVLVESQVRDMEFIRLDFTEFSDKKIKAVLYGLPVKKFGKDIKAVTYHELYLKKMGDHFEAKIIFDI